MTGVSLFFFFSSFSLPPFSGGWGPSEGSQTSVKIGKEVNPDMCIVSVHPTSIICCFDNANPLSS